jgi:hypothetical protein
MDRFGVEIGLIGMGGEVAAKALKDHPNRFIPDGQRGPESRHGRHPGLVQQYEKYGVRAFGAFNAGYDPQVGISDALMYPIYSKCVELGVPIFACAGVPGPGSPCGHRKYA